MEIFSDVNKFIKWIDDNELTDYDIMDLKLKGRYGKTTRQRHSKYEI